MLLRIVDDYVVFKIANTHDFLLSLSLIFSEACLDEFIVFDQNRFKIFPLYSWFFCFCFCVLFSNLSRLVGSCSSLYLISLCASAVGVKIQACTCHHAVTHKYEKSDKRTTVLNINRYSYNQLKSRVFVSFNLKCVCSWNLC